VIIPENERVKPSTKKPDSPAKGTKVMATSHQPVPPINKDDFKIWQPWLKESNLPKWAEDL
jgi:hypothetical protein